MLMNTCCITIKYIEEDVDEYLLYNNRIYRRGC